MKLSNIINYPAYYKDRIDKLKTVNLSDISFDIKDKLIITALANRYRLIVRFEEDFEINHNSIIKVDCTCDSFKFEFANAIRASDGLLYPEKYLEKPSRSRNIYQYVVGCKHLMALGRFLYNRRNVINQDIKRRLS